MLSLRRRRSSGKWTSQTLKSHQYDSANGCCLWQYGANMVLERIFYSPNVPLPHTWLSTPHREGTVIAAGNSGSCNERPARP